MFSFTRLPSLVSVFLVFLLFGIGGADGKGIGRRNRHGDSGTGNHWVDIWGSMPQLTETSNLPPAPFTQPSSVFLNATIRQTIRLTADSPYIRLRISNAFGGSDLSLSFATIAFPINGTAGTSAIEASSLQTLTFSGSTAIQIPNGALAVSDPAKFGIKAGQVVTITLYLREGQAGNNVTSHPGSRTTSWFATGNRVMEGTLGGEGVASAAHWYFISAVEGWVPESTSAFVIVGDSITDGRGSDTDKNNRWPDLVFNRLQSSPRTSHISIINQAAGGNRILADGLGPNALGRIDRDVLAHSGVKYAMVFEGVNDIGTGDVSPAAQQIIGDRLIQAFSQIITRVHAAGLPIFGATITPFSAPKEYTGQPYSDAEREKTRQRVNVWIRESGKFDAVVDFDRLLRNETVPSQLADAYNGGDYLHPNHAGYQRLADHFPVGLFAEFEGGVDGFV